MARRPTREELRERAIVAKRNVLNEARLSMNKLERRFFATYLSIIDPRDPSTRLVRFPLKEFQHIFRLENSNTRYMKFVLKRLLGRVAFIPTETGGYIGFQLFKRCRVDLDESSGQWYVEIDAHDDALPLMFEFKEKFTEYELWNILCLESTNQMRMYEILKQHEKQKQWEFTVQELRELLDIKPTEYTGRTGWANFKIRVLDACQQALKENTDICYTYERGKTGRGGKWLSVVFHIKKNKSYSPSSTFNVPDEDDDEIDDEEFHVLPDQLVMFEVSADDAQVEKVKTYSQDFGYEFNEQDMRCIIARLETIPIEKLPFDSVTGEKDIEVRKHRYCQEKYADICRYDPAFRLMYLLQVMENDAAAPVRSPQKPPQVKRRTPKRTVSESEKKGAYKITEDTFQDEE